MRAKPIKPLEGLDLTGNAWELTAPVPYVAQKDDGSFERRLAVTNVSIPIVSPDAAPVVAQWEFRGRDGESNAKASFRAHEGRVFVCDEAIEETNLAIETIALGRKPDFWRRLLQPYAYIPYAPGKTASKMTAIEHPFTDIGYDERVPYESQDSALFVESRPVEDPEFLANEAYVQKSAGGRLIIDGKLWSPSTGPAFVIHPSKFDLRWLHPRSTSLLSSLDGMGLAVDLDEIDEVYRSRFAKANIDRADGPTILDASAFAYPAATISLLDASWRWLSKARCMTMGGKSHAFIGAAENLRATFLHLYPATPREWKDVSWDRTWLRDHIDLSEPLELSTLAEQTLRLLSAWPEKKPLSAETTIEVYAELAARTYARRRQAEPEPLTEDDIAALAELDL